LFSWNDALTPPLGPLKSPLRVVFEYNCNIIFLIDFIFLVKYSFMLLLPNGQVMLTLSHSSILRYRLVCLILSVGYFSYQFTEANYDNFGIQFRYLTIWGLTAAMVATWLLYKSTHKGLPESYLPFVSATAVLNAMVVFLYWKLYFIDPSLVNYLGSIVWFQDYYLHILGPVLIILDAFLFNNSFT